MESNNLFFVNQNGFRKGKSSIQAVNNIVNKLYEHRNNVLYICYQESDTALIKKTALAIFKSMIIPYLEYGMIM